MNATTTISEHSPLLELPPELRNRIWDLTFRGEKGTYREQRLHRPFPAILHVCREIRGDALQMFVANTHFFVNCRIKTTRLRSCVGRLGWYGRWLRWVSLEGKVEEETNGGEIKRESYVVELRRGSETEDWTVVNPPTASDFSNQNNWHVVNDVLGKLAQHGLLEGDVNVEMATRRWDARVDYVHWLWRRYYE